MYGGRGFGGFVLMLIGKMEILYTIPGHYKGDLEDMKVGITSNFTHIILYCILKVIGVASVHSLVPP